MLFRIHYLNLYHQIHLIFIVVKMSKINIRNYLREPKDKIIPQKTPTISTPSANHSSTNSSVNISMTFMKDMNFPKLFDQTPMLFSFNPQTTKNSTSMTRSTSSSGFQSGTRTPSSNSSYSSFKNFFQSREESKGKSIFNRKQKDITIDLAKKQNGHKSKRNSYSKQHRYQSSTLNTKNQPPKRSLPTNPADLIPKEENIKVFVRIKPIKCQQLDHQISNQQSYIQRMDSKHLEIDNKFMAYDHIFQDQSTQSEVFEVVARPVLDNVLEGYNGTIFAYGQTGSGKTHTIFGQLDEEKQQGLIPRVIKELFKKKTVNQQLSMAILQIYKEELIDLLSSKKDLKIKETSTGVYVENQSNITINSAQEALYTIESSLKNRRVASTKLNDKSSRSHTILTLYINSGESQTKLCLIDLAGSEKVNKAGVCGENLEETKKINYSLSCLGNVINALVTRKKSDHIPFRDSKLTRILKDSLSGKFKTSIIVNCSAQDGTYDQTLSSLKFADRAKKIKVTISKNSIKGKQNVEYLQLMIKKLTTDLEETKKQLVKYKEICNQGKTTGDQANIQESSDPIKPQKKPLQPHNEELNYNISCKSQTDVDLTPRPIPSERANADQNMKKYGNPISFLKNKLKAPSSRTSSSRHKQIQSKEISRNENSSQQNLNMQLNQLSSLNVSRSVGNFFGEINSPSISSLSIRQEQNTEDLSLNFSLQKSESQFIRYE